MVLFMEVSKKDAYSVGIDRIIVGQMNISDSRSSFVNQKYNYYHPTIAIFK